jgi:RNA polymerase sigma factor (sigma-70 family)
MDERSSSEDGCPQGAVKTDNINARERQVEWEPFIKRNARSVARGAKDRALTADDIAQEGRLRLLRVPASTPSTKAWVGTVVRNEMRRVAGRPSPYERLTPAAYKVADYRAESEKTAVMRMAVREWVDQLPDDVRAVYELTYVSDLSQREAAAVLGISQSKVSQLHQELLRAGRREFAPVAA